MASRPQPPKGGKTPPAPARKPPTAPPPKQTQTGRQASAAPPQGQPPRAPAAPQRPAAEQPGRQVAPRPQAGAMSTEFAEAMGGHASGQGLSQSAADNLVPLAYILQKLSPQCEPKKPEFIEGSRPGQIWLKQVGLVEADQQEKMDGIVVQPCHFSKWIMEWIPRDSGGGLVGRYQMEIGETAEQALNRHGVTFDKVVNPKNPKRQNLITPDGHELIEVREHVCRAYYENDPERVMPFVFPMSGTNHTVSRGWMLMMNSKSLNGQRLNSYTSLYRLRTKWNQNEQGDWFNYMVDDLGTLDKAAEYVPGLDWQRELVAGKALADAFGSGEKQTDVSDYTHETGGTDGEGGGYAEGDAEGQHADTDPI